MRKEQSVALISDLKKRGYVFINGIFYPPNSKEALNKKPDEVVFLPGTGKYIEKNCKTCGLSFYSFYHDHVKGMGNYCCKKCHNLDRIKYNLENGSRLIKNCLNCAKEFKTVQGEITKGGGKYCSAKCNTDFHTGINSPVFKEKIPKKCQECGKEYDVTPAWSDRNKFCSRVCASVANYRNNGQPKEGHSRGKGGKRSDLENRFFRSSWEANYARYLNLLIKLGQIIKWEYEVDTFEFVEIKKGTRFYTPDFKVFLINGKFEYHEVKGWMDDKSITRHKRMDKYFPEIIIKMIDTSWFRANKSRIKPLLEFWEDTI